MSTSCVQVQKKDIYIYNSKGRICPIDYLHPFLRDMMLDYENEGLASRVRIGKGSGVGRVSPAYEQLVYACIVAAKTPYGNASS